MKNKPTKLVAIIIVIIMIMEIFGTVTYASFLGGIKSESGTYTPPPTPPDAPSTSIPSNPSTSTGDSIPTSYIYHHEWISGNAYEDLGLTKIGTGSEGGDCKDDQTEKIPIEGIEVRLMQGGNVVDSTRTDEKGNYRFDPGDGTYSIQYCYGNLTDDIANENNAEKVKNILKYNGQDYMTVETAVNKEVLDTKKIEIEQSGKGALQLYIALDCSYSMRDTKVTVNGKEKTRLEVAVDSAKKLCTSLIDSGDNIYVGLVFFSGTSYRAVSLTKNTDLLYEALDDINSNGWYTPNTNVVGALDKAYESYCNNDAENSNRHLVILSDGVPTSDGSTETYWNDSDSTIYNKLDTIQQSTINKIEELKSNGVNVVSLVTKSDDAEETQYVQNIFSHSSIFRNIEDGNETIEIIIKDLKNYLLVSTDKKEYTETHNVLAGYEDAGRRQEVNNNFSDTLNYDNTIMFDQIDNYNDTDKAKELSEKTYMTVMGGQGYEIDHNTYGTDPIPQYGTDPDTGEKVIVAYIQHVSIGHEDEVLGLAKRPGFSLVTKITATGLRVILQNGQQLSDEVNQTREPGSTFPIFQVLDNELAHGTTIQIEYTISVKNDSSIQCNHLEILSHLPEDFVFDNDAALITSEGYNRDTGWEQVSLEELKENNLVTEDTVNKYGYKSSLKLTLDNNGQGADGFYIAPGGEWNIKYVTTRLISNLDSISNPSFEIASEVLGYKNNESRRMAYIQGTETKFLSAYPGDSAQSDFTDELTQGVNAVTIIPPTGLDSLDSSKMTTILSVLFTCLVGNLLTK